jgi:4-alpha-glucanotransferase
VSGPEPRSEDERRRLGGRSAPPDGWGIITAYEDAFGAWTEVPASTRDRLVEAMDGDPRADGPPAVDAVVVTQVGTPVHVEGATEVVTEDGTRRAVAGDTPADLPAGYHRLLVTGEDEPRSLIVSPGRCYLPDDLRAWGWAVQLYALRSGASWGLGDLADLRELARWSADAGAGTILVNPLDAVTPVRPRETSPYYPTSRRFLDPIYLRVDEVPGVSDLPGFAAAARHGAELTAATTIDRDAIAELKYRLLEERWRAGGVGDEPGFRALLDERGDELTTFATFCVLAEELGSGWHDWPDRFQHPDAPAVRRFADERADRIRFHAWLQWLTDDQLRRAGEPLALLGDLPIGADPDGADAWAWQDVLATGVTVGAPPDELGPQGQDWQLPAFVPWKLRQAGYEPFIRTVRAAMRHVGGLRIDHVLGLFRMFWVPPGGTAADGAYVRMPTSDLLDILALESHRAGTFVVGEDLGTVAEGVREEMDARDLLRYQVWWFETDPLEAWSEKALASVSTHDLPTVAGVWTGRDAEMLEELGHAPDHGWHAELRARIAGATGIAEDASADEAVVALHGHVATAPDRLVLAQLDDAVATAERPNVPGTDREERPANWSLPLPVPAEELPSHPTVRAVADAMGRGRAAAVTPSPGASRDDDVAGS